MRHVCDADPRNWIETNKKYWTRRDLRQFDEARAADVAAIGKDEPATAVQDFCRSFIADACLVDIDGNEYHGLDAIFAAKMDGLDAAAEYFWSFLPLLLFQARQRLGNRISGD